MKNQRCITILLLALFLLAGCKPALYPKHPHYEIHKPKVIYTPSKKNLDKMVKDLQGSPYVWAEEGPNKFDCSGFTYYMYGSMGIELPRVAREQAKVGKRISAKELQYGDLIFFATGKSRKKITHVGMYLGNGWFTHASTAKGEVVYSNLFTSPYYKKRLCACRRYLPSTTQKVASSETWNSGKKLTKPSTLPGIIHKAHPGGMKRAVIIKTEMKEIEQPSAKGNLYVQVGSFVGKPKRTLLHTITNRGFAYKLIQFPKNGKSITKLLIGPYITRGETKSVLAKVRKYIQKDAFIAEIR